MNDVLVPHMDQVNGAGESEVSQRLRAIESAVGLDRGPLLGRPPPPGYSGDV